MAIAVLSVSSLSSALILTAHTGFGKVTGILSLVMILTGMETVSPECSSFGFSFAIFLVSVGVLSESLAASGWLFCDDQK